GVPGCRQPPTDLRSSPPLRPPIVTHASTTRAGRHTSPLLVLRSAWLVQQLRQPATEIATGCRKPRPTWVNQADGVPGARVELTGFEPVTPRLPATEQPASRSLQHLRPRC